MMDPALAQAIQLKASHLKSYLANTGRGQHDEEELLQAIAKLRLDLSPLEVLKLMQPYQLLDRLRAAGLTRL